MVALQQFTDPDFGACTVLYKSQTGLQANVCLFASHTNLPFLPEYIYYYLNDIKATRFSIIFISSSAIADEDLKKLSVLADVVIEKENRGTDFGAWCATLRWLGTEMDFESLYLCNDSVFGLFMPFALIHETFTNKQEDLIGITDSHQGVGYHIQSYFVGAKRQVLQSEAWRLFWKDMSFQEDKRKVIEYYEIGLTQVLMKEGFHWFIWSDWSKKVSYRKLVEKVSKSEALRKQWLNRLLQERENIILDINPSSFLWQELIQACNSPVIKRELFLFDHLYEEHDVETSWLHILEHHTSYPLALIKDFLIQYFFYKAWRFEKEEFHIVRLTSLNSDQKANANTDAPFDVLQSIARLLALSPDMDKNAVQSPLMVAELAESNIRFLMLALEGQADGAIRCLLVHLNEQIIDFEPVQLERLKSFFKKNHNAIILVPNENLKHVAGSLLGLRPEGILTDDALLSPHSGVALYQRLRHLYEVCLSGEGQLDFLQRPTLAQVIADALRGKNRASFLPTRAVDAEEEQRVAGENAKFINKQLKHSNFATVRAHYMDIYECTPGWYKKIGQVIKLLSGRKKIVFEVKDKHAKTEYRQTAEDVAHWYYLQYEVLPDWYKKLGKQWRKKEVGNG